MLQHPEEITSEQMIGMFLKNSLSICKFIVSLRKEDKTITTELQLLTRRERTQPQVRFSIQKYLIQTSVV